MAADLPRVVMTDRPGSSGAEVRPVPIVLLLQDLEFGGTQRYAVNLAKHLDRTLFAPRLWMLRGGTDMVCEAAATGVELAWLSRSPRVVWPHALARLARRLVSERPQILVTLTVVPNIWGRLLARLARVPIVISTYRGGNSHQYEGVLWRLSSRIICNADILRTEMIRRHKVGPERITVVRNGVDANPPAPDDSCRAPQPTILYAGRLELVKDPVTLLEAFRILLETVPAAHLEIVGNGSLRRRLEGLRRRHSLESRVRIADGRLDIGSAFGRAWVLALPSRREASPNVVLEAMAAGLPVVASRVGGVPELVEEGVTGLMVEPGRPDLLAGALGGLLIDEPLRAMMGRRARARVLADFTMDRMVAETERVFTEALDTHAGRRG